jgi:hypothetical protein
MGNYKFVAVLSCHVPRIQQGFQETDKHVWLCVCLRLSVYVQLSDYDSFCSGNLGCQTSILYDKLQKLSRRSVCVASVFSAVRDTDYRHGAHASKAV